MSGLPGFDVGQVLDADDVNTWLKWHCVSKGDNTSRTSTTLTEDPQLKVWLTAGAWVIRGFYSYTGPVGACFRWGHWTINGWLNESDVFYSQAGVLYSSFRTHTDSNWAYTYGTGINDRASVMSFGTVTIGSDSYLTLKWSPRFSYTSGTSLKEGSFIAYRKISE